MARYNTEVDRKWQGKWAETNLYRFDENNLKKKLYVLEMFSYPSGSSLHAGHWFNYGPVDSWARMKKMQGYNIFQPMGFDAFGLPAENFAIKTKIHPKDSTLKNIEIMEKQLKSMGAMFNWENEVITCQPEYYKWTQWLFIKLYEKGLAYRKNAPVNWCPSCNTVLANEQVIDNHCERCNTEVTKKDLTQWFLKITDYADELLTDLDKLDWPDKTKAMQRHWIGKSTGAEITFKTAGSDISINVFTTRADTLFGVTYLVLAPENPIVKVITTVDRREAVERYTEETKQHSDIERQSVTREKTGVFTGAFAINPISGERIPVWVADYVLANYGTGAVMAVPAHDERDYEFAKKFKLPIRKVIQGGAEELFTDEGILINSKEFNGLSSSEGRRDIVKKLETMGLGKNKINYKLRDWLVSRQRYWGAPIPVIHCEKCGIVPVPEKDLPVRLPYDVEFKPDGKSPLAKCSEFMNTICPECGAPALRDPDTLDTFVCSSWYYLRYPDSRNAQKAFNPDIINKILPVDKYVGGPEHACMHLLYARFITKALRDMGYLNFDEPFLSLTHQGLILGPDGQKMSKSRGNTICPDDYINEFGSDVFRMYLMFGFSYTDGGAWSDEGIKSMAKFIERIERLVDNSIKIFNDARDTEKALDKEEKELDYRRHSAIKGVTEDAEKMQFNTAIARIMEYFNALSKYINEESINPSYIRECMLDFIKLLAPFAPHFAEEQWNRLNPADCSDNSYSVFSQAWPAFDPKALIRDEVEIAIQVNGKVKGRISVSSDMNDDEIRDTVLKNAVIVNSTAGRTVNKVIVIRGRLVNIVVK